MDFKAADWQISIRSIEWEGGICLLPWSLGRWGRLRSSSLSHKEFGLCYWNLTVMGLRPHLFFIPLALLVLQSLSFELQDTIHTLMEENIHLHDQLENLTQALRELKRMLWHHSNGTFTCKSANQTANVVKGE